MNLVIVQRNLVQNSKTFCLINYISTAINCYVLCNVMENHYDEIKYVYKERKLFMSSNDLRQNCIKI